MKWTYSHSWHVQYTASVHCILLKRSLVLFKHDALCWNYPLQLQSLPTADTSYITVYKQWVASTGMKTRFTQLNKQKISFPAMDAYFCEICEILLPSLYKRVYESWSPLYSAWDLLWDNVFSHIDCSWGFWLFIPLKDLKKEKGFKNEKKKIFQCMTQHINTSEQYNTVQHIMIMEFC